MPTYGYRELDGPLPRVPNEYHNEHIPTHRSRKARRTVAEDSAAYRPGRREEIYYLRRRNSSDPTRDGEQPSRSLVSREPSRYPPSSHRTPRNLTRAESYHGGGSRAATRRAPTYSRDDDTDHSIYGLAPGSYRSRDPDPRPDRGGGYEERRPPPIAAPPHRTRSNPVPRAASSTRSRRAKRHHTESAPSDYPATEPSPRPRESRRRGSSSSTGGRDNKKLLAGVARHAFEAGAVTAAKVHNDPGPWSKSKGTKVAASALGAAAIDTFMDHKAPAVRGGVRHTVAKELTKTALGALAEHRM